MGRLIDEDDVVKEIAISTYNLMDEEDNKQLIDDIRLFVPTAQPEPKWIPCSERLPDKSGLYLTWTKFPYEEEPSWLIINYDADCEAFGEWEEHYHPDTLGYLDSEFNEFENVVAWMPLPECYKGE